MSPVIAPPLAMTDEERSALEVMARSTSLGHCKVVQAKALLLAGDGVGTNEVARQCHTDDGSTHWSTRLMAIRFGIGKDTVARIWREHNLNRGSLTPSR